MPPSPSMKRLPERDSVADAFGVSTQAIYHYFPGGLRSVKIRK